jgi:hypothetical protein
MITATPALAEPFAAWLELTADAMEERRAVEGTASKAVHPVHFAFGLEAPRNDWTAALAVARVINGGPPTVWSDAVPPGGMVCAVYAPGRPDDICGTPVESEPCPEHNSGGQQ